MFLDTLLLCYHLRAEHSFLVQYTSQKSQQALKLQQEQLKTERKTMSREQREAEKQRQFELRQQKRKAKHSFI